jgi:anti-sigma factor RsiW
MHPDIDVLLPYADGDLPPEQARDLVKHLDKCADCRLEVDRLRASAQVERPSAPPAPNILAGIRQWAARRTPAHEAAVKLRMAAELDPYLGAAGTANVLGRSAPGVNLLSVIQPVLTDFLGRRAVERLVDRIVENTIMRT